MTPNTDNMVEIVALAIFKATFHPDDAADEVLVAAKRVEWPEDWARAVRHARAALAAMRTPTEEMSSAGTQAADDYWERDRGEIVWQAMIDQALAEPTKEEA